MEMAAATPRLLVGGQPPAAVEATATPPRAAAVAVGGAIVSAVAEATVPVAVAATIDKLSLFVSPKTGAAAGTSTQPATAPAFLFAPYILTNSTGRF